MSIANISAFLDRVSQDETLAARVHAVYAEVDSVVAHSLSALADKQGLPFTAEAFLHEQNAALSDAALGSVAGGTGETEGMSGSDYINPAADPRQARYKSNVVYYQAPGRRVPGQH